MKTSKILVYLFGSLGDTLVAVPALRALRRNFPDSELVLLQNIPHNGNIVRASQVIPPDLIDGYIEYTNSPGKLSKISNFYKLSRILRRRKFQAAAYLVISERLPNSVKRDKLFFRWCGISNFYGFHSFTAQELYPLDEFGLPSPTISEAARKIVRLKKDGVNSVAEDFRRPFLTFSAAELENTKKWLATHRKKPTARLISVAPGCKTQANAWSIENFIAIGRRLLAEDNCELLITGGKAERDVAAQIIDAWGEGINAAGVFPVRESGALLSFCDFHFGLDTGTTHLAASVGTPCCSLFGGRNNPGHWYPTGDGHTVIFHPVKCAGCRLFVCPIPDHPCMNGISVSAVFEKLREFIKNKDENAAAPIRVFAV